MVFNGPIYIHTFLLNGKPADLKQRLAMRKQAEERAEAEDSEVIQ